jgi:hypothetical protein
MKSKDQGQMDEQLENMFKDLKQEYSNEKKTVSEKYLRAKNCPHLGLAHDPKTRFTYPSEGNYCHKVSPFQEVGISYQGQICLDVNKFRTCPVFQKGWEGKLPKSIRSSGENNRRARASSSPSVGLLWFFLILAFVALVGLGYLYLTDITLMKAQLATLMAAEPNSANSGVVVVTATEYLSEEPTATLDAISLLIPSNTPEPAITEAPEETSTEQVEETPTPAESPTPFVDYSRFSMTPHFGPDKMFILHPVALGESLPVIARRYDTTQEMIILLNCIADPIRIDMVFLIAPGREDVGFFRSFAVLQPEEETPITALASEYFTSVQDIQYYNGWGEDETVIEAGNWVIVPNFCEE